MMNFIETLNTRLDEHFLLKHEFYQAWNAGTLPKTYLALYAQQYFHHVDAFPRYISATHANCTDLKTRQVLLENLVDEEQGDRNHPELWLRFAEAVGTTREEVKQSAVLPSTQHLIDTFLGAAKSSYAEGVGALYAYERQVPAVAASKIDGLAKHYDISDERAIDFFKTHLEADVWHSDETRSLLEALPEADREKAMNAADSVAKALWGFLSGVQAATIV